ncbi:HEPN domain-containing protein [Geoalkalibacter subterraneus]|uniref:HEPN domain-containing protein n=1 Tax=Geoalkalibacter subterraneus TaxID=483547 RepID=UPI0009FD4AE0|nr:HEPN domain-containing protein [Geoalkalibacter subterraneus]
MLNIEKQITYWRNGAVEDLGAATDLVMQGHVRHGLFFAHLALEKILKAHVCRFKNQIAPPIHNLLRLAEIADLSLEQKQRDFLAEVNSFNIEGRYPGVQLPLPTQREAEEYLQKIKELHECLSRMFEMQS